MTYKIHLFSADTRPPTFWVNFFDAHRPDSWNDGYLEDILKKEYNGNFYWTGEPSNSYGDRYVEFDSYEEYIMFVLRWL